jgi:hypothetical protein
MVANCFFPRISNPLSSVKTRSCPDFNMLLLLGQQQHISYGEYLLKNKDSTRKQRRQMIVYHYKYKQ